MQRLRIKFARMESVKYISHLDIMRFWERALRRGDIPLAYSEGFSPHPKISIALPLPVGVTSETELADIELSKKVAPAYFNKIIKSQLPAGFAVLQVFEIPKTAPSIQSLVCSSVYLATIKLENGLTSIEKAIQHVIGRDSIPWSHHRDTGDRKYDIRPLIEEIKVLAVKDNQCILEMRLKAGNQGAGRPEQVVALLGLSDKLLSIHRTRIILTGERQTACGKALTHTLGLSKEIK